jgi:gas vesicle protein
MESEKSRTSPLWYLMGGAAFGAVLGVLYAPKKGSELRLDIAEMVLKGREQRRAMMSRLSAMIPARVKAAAMLGAVKEGGAEALREAADKIHHNGDIA